MAQDWQMPRLSDRCQCGAEFEVDQPLTAALLETPQGYERHDYCPACELPAGDAVVAHWKTRRRPPRDADKRVTFDAQAILSFFERLSADEDAVAASAEKTQFRFVLALLLWRKKLLNFEATEHEDEREFWLFNTKRSSDRYRVLRPAIDETEMEQLSLQVEALLSGQIEAMEATPADA